MIIPPERLSPEVLRNLLEAYVTREGTDYGEVELSLDEKVGMLKPAVMQGKVLVVYDEATSSVNLMPKEDYDNAAPTS